MRKFSYIFIIITITLNTHFIFNMDQIQKIKKEPKKKKFSTQHQTSKYTSAKYKQVKKYSTCETCGLCGLCCLDTCGRCVLCNTIAIPLYSCCYLIAPVCAYFSTCFPGADDKDILLEEEIFKPLNNFTKKLWRNSLVKKWFNKPQEY